MGPVTETQNFSDPRATAAQLVTIPPPVPHKEREEKSEIIPYWRHSDSEDARVQKKASQGGIPKLLKESL